MQLVHGLAHHRYGSIAVAARGFLPGGPQLGDRDQEGTTLAQPVADLHNELQPAVTVGRGVPIQQRDTQRVRPRSVRIVAGRSAVCTASSLARTAESSARRTPQCIAIP